MFQKSKNPKIEELTKSHRERRINLSDLETPIIEGVKSCIWCLLPLKGRQYKWCSPECQTSAWAWANPQKEEGLKYLLIAQGWKCKKCGFDYRPTMEEIVKNDRRRKPRPVTDEDLAKVPASCIRRLKARLKPSDRPEVDHIRPIYKGGQALGFENHQAICFSCHKKKTSKDLKKEK